MTTTPIHRSSMHVVFFNRSFHPDQSATGQLLTDLCTTLVAEHGCRVTVVCGRRAAGGDHHRPEGNGTETVGGARVVRALGTRFSKRRFVGRAANYVTYFLSACWAGLRLDRPDVVVAMTDPPIIGLAAWVAARRAGAPLVMHYQDIFPEVAALLEDFHSARVNAALERVNRFLVRKAALVIALGGTMRRRLIEGKGAPADRTVVLENFADTAALVPGVKKNPFAIRHGLAESFVVMHSGNLGLSQSLDTLVDAAALLGGVADLRVVLQGDGVKRADLEDRARGLGLGHVMFLPFASREELGDAFATADVFVISLRRGLAGYIVPSKVYGILAAGRPFVAAVEPDCEVAALAETAQCGLVVGPGDARALADAVLTYYRDANLRREAGERARRASAAFDRSVHAASYLRLLRALVGQPVGDRSPVVADRA